MHPRSFAAPLRLSHSGPWRTTIAHSLRASSLSTAEAAFPVAGFDNALVKIWPEFVDYRARLRTLLPFLVSTIPPHARVIDLAAGVGYEAVALAERGYRVTANEVNPVLRQHATLHAKGFRNAMTWTSRDWQHISTDMKGSRFDALLLLGNSFCLLHNQEERQRALAGFSALCARGSVFVIDIRNFTYILRARDEILAGNFRYSRRVMYCGKLVSGRPVAFSQDLVTFGYFDEHGGQRGTLEMVPLLVDDLITACRSAGFNDVTVFSDLQPGRDETADFFTCVFRR